MIVTIVGARPQFIKASVVSKALSDIGIKENIIHTGQHYDEQMSDVFFRELGIPDCVLNLQIGSDTHARQTARMLIGIEDYLSKNVKEIRGVLLYGDTNSTLAGALVAAKLGIKIIHVESGLRSFNRSMPEEVNRITSDHLSDLLFCPSEQSVNQLKLEGITKNVYNVGDVMYDALLEFSNVKTQPQHDFFNSEYSPYLLLTIHRPSNTDNLENLNSIIQGLKHFNGNILWPIHPRTRKVVFENKLTIPQNIKTINPLSYLEMLWVIEQCSKVITDSGGLQKESYWMRKPCITLREDTEWIETLHDNWNILTGANENEIKSAIEVNIEKDSWFELYGNGKAAVEIARVIKRMYF